MMLSMHESDSFIHRINMYNVLFHSTYITLCRQRMMILRVWQKLIRWKVLCSHRNQWYMHIHYLRNKKLVLNSVEILIKFVAQYLEIVYFKLITVYDQPFVDTQQSGRKWRKTLTKSAVLLVLLNQKLRHLTEKWDYNCFLLTVIHAAMAVLLF